MRIFLYSIIYYAIDVHIGSMCKRIRCVYMSRVIPKTMSHCVAVISQHHLAEKISNPPL